MKGPANAIWRQFEGRLIVSCQARPGEHTRTPGTLARFARAAVDSGAVAIRAEGAPTIVAIRKVVDVPIIGIRKIVQHDGLRLITPSLRSARALVKAGAEMVALDCTVRGQRFGAIARLQAIKRELGVPVFADIATLDEAVTAEQAGADLVLTTMRGYTKETAGLNVFEPEFIAQLVATLHIPVIAEGHVETPEQARAALDAGAFSVVVGSAITRPNTIAQRFVRAVES